MALVNIKSAQWYSQDVSGIFTISKQFVEDTKSKRDGFIWVSNKDTGKPQKLHVFKEDLDFENVCEVSQEEIARDISDRFDTMETLVEGVINGHIKALAMSGAAGIGKTYGTVSQLEQAKRDGRINKFTKLSGYCTPIGLYVQLWEHQNEGDILLLDDIDPFENMESLNVLKAALDTSGTRNISWNSNSSFLRDMGADRNFEFKGTIVFITNMNFDEMIEKATKMSPHFAALVNRCVYLDLGIHTNEEIMIRIHQVVESTSLMRDLRVAEFKDDILRWMDDNRDSIRSISIRTIIRMAEYIKTSPSKWETIARTTLIKR